MERIIKVKGITKGYIIRREWALGESGYPHDYTIVWNGEEKAWYDRLYEAKYDLFMWDRAEGRLLIF